MIGNNLPQLTGTKRSLLVLLASSALFTAGCSNMMSTALSSGAVPQAKSIGGKVHGGFQPVIGATVKLYYAGQTPSFPTTEAATTTSAADGSFSFTQSGTTGQPENGNIYSCPTTSNPLVYVIAKGGNTLGDGVSTESNSAAAFIGVYGDCSELTSSNFIELNEATTVATMVAVQQYFDPNSEGLSADGIGTAKIAIDSTPATIANMVNLTTGFAVTSTNIAGIHGLGASTVVATPESSKINLMANILASCVNNISASAPNCTTLFANAVPPNPATTSRPAGTRFSQATDVLQALYFMLTNPTSGGTTNQANLFGLSAGVGAAFQPILTDQPSDWTVAIVYSSTSSCGTGGGALFSAPSQVAIDLNGQVWVANGEVTNGNVVQLTSNGAPSACNSFGSGATAAKSALFIDSTGSTGGAGKIWSSLSGSSTITRFNPIDSTHLTFTAAGPVLAITGDGTGNIFLSTATGLYEIPAAFAAGATATTPTLLSSTVTNAVSLMPDKTGAIWASSGTSTLQQVVGTTVNPFTASANTQSVAVNSANNVFVSSVTPGNSISYFANGGSGYLLLGSVAGPLGGLNQPTAITLDGASNVWIVNMLADTNPAFATDPTAPATQFGISEGSINGIPFSPDSSSGAFQKPASFLSPGSQSGIMVDQSGNVWIAGGGATNNFITEIVGAGVPLYQPYAQGLENGRFGSQP
jgi:hypothetical protein